MEESVGKLWHGLITRAADQRFPQASVSLDEVRKSLAVYLRALSCNPRLSIEVAGEQASLVKRSWLQKIAGSGRYIQVASRYDDRVFLPAELAVFPTYQDNHDLYFWLAALAAVGEVSGHDLLAGNCRLVSQVLTQYPSLKPRYLRLVGSSLKLRPDPEQIGSLTDIQKATEKRLRYLLRKPWQARNHEGSLDGLPAVPLWLYWPQVEKTTSDHEPGDVAPQKKKKLKGKEKQRRKGEYVEDQDGRDGLLLFRLESLFSWSEYVPVNRTADEGDEQDMLKAADDLDVISLSKADDTVSANIHFELELPATVQEDVALGPGIHLPEWDYRQQLLMDDRCCVQALISAQAQPRPLPENLKKAAQTVKRRFEYLLPQRRWQRGQAEGTELDLDAYVHHFIDQQRGQLKGMPRLFRNLSRCRRDLSCLLLADLSLSTDAWVDDEHRVIDSIRDSVFLFSEALAVTGDRLAIQGFSSGKRQEVRLHWIKDFDEPLSDEIRGRISAMEPGYYTRMGAAIRYATRCLEQENSEQRLLLLVTDGKPNDVDNYEGRYGIEDTRQAVIEAHKKGLQTFCVTIDEEANRYLPYLFGPSGYVFVRDVAALPTKLTALYSRLAA